MNRSLILALIVFGCGKDQERIIYKNPPQLGETPAPEPKNEPTPEPVPTEEPKPIETPTPIPSPTPTPTPIPEPPKFPALLDLAPWQMNSAAAGHKNQNEAAQITLASNIAKAAIVELTGALGNLKPEVKKENGQDVEVRKANGYEGYQTFVNNIQNGQIWKDGKKRMHFVRDHKTGAFRGILIAGPNDKHAPLASIFNPNGNGTSNQILIMDIGNDRQNDIRGELVSDSKTFAGKTFKLFQIFQGGMRGQGEGVNLLNEFGGFGL